MRECKILIADDEKLAREAIRLHLHSITHLQIIEAVNGKDALEKLISSEPDIVFLDIQMPVQTGLQVLEKLPHNYHPYLIVVTAYDEYAVQAFDYNATDYLLKPFTDERFSKAFNKAYELWKSKAQSTVDISLENQFRRLLEDIYKEPSSLTIKDGSKIFVVHLSDIQYFEAEGEYISVVTAEKKYLHRDSLTRLESILPTARFVRIHKSVIVNLAFIKELQSHFNGDYSVLLKSGKMLRLSRNYRQQLMEKLG